MGRQASGYKVAKKAKDWIKLLQTVRRLIETVIGQLCVSEAPPKEARFNFEKVWARDMWHLTSRLNRKLLAQTVCVWLNRLFGLEPLKFDDLDLLDGLIQSLTKLKIETKEDIFSHLHF